MNNQKIDKQNNNKQLIKLDTTLEKNFKPKQDLKIIAINYNFIQIVDIPINSYIKRLFQY